MHFINPTRKTLGHIVTAVGAIAVAWHLIRATQTRRWWCGRPHRSYSRGAHLNIGAWRGTRTCPGFGFEKFERPSARISLDPVQSSGCLASKFGVCTGFNYPWRAAEVVLYSLRQPPAVDWGCPMQSVGKRRSPASPMENRERALLAYPSFRERAADDPPQGCRIQTLAGHKSEFSSHPDKQRHTRKL